jgi:hypothetical protein
MIRNEISLNLIHRKEWGEMSGAKLISVSSSKANILVKIYGERYSPEINIHLESIFAKSVFVFMRSETNIHELNIG